ncbi:hypothetical protein V493_04506, partial [Pseudogymnoascus sp. VKM F-4281 (FW-2241)]
SAATLPLYPAFVHLPTPPAVLDATLLSAAPAPTGTGTAVFQLSIDCPTDKNDANEDCRDLSVFPAELWHTQNGAWGGKMTKDGATTTWSCDLNGGGSAAEATLGPHCVDTIASSGAKEVVNTIMMGCHGDRQLVPLRIQEGAEKFPEGWEAMLMGEMNGAYGGRLEDMPCAKTWTMQSDAPTVTRNDTMTATETTMTGGAGETGTETSSGDAVPSETGEGSGVRKGGSGGLLVVGAAAAMWLGA